MRSQEKRQPLSAQLGINKLPDAPGVYYFLASKKASKLRSSEASILYIGKATSLKDRVKSYFSNDLLLTRGPKIEKMIHEAESLRFVATDSVLEALILETAEIKKYQPLYNTKEKDDRSYNYVVVTKEDFPRVLLVRGRNLKLEAQSYKLSAIFGPFPHGSELREALKIVRKIFPFRDAKCKITPKLKPCFNAQIGLCPGPCAGWISKKDYRKIIKHFSLFFEGKKVDAIKSLEKEMKTLAKAHKFEEADKVKKQIFALDHIQDVALIKADLQAKTVPTGRQGSKLEAAYRIEAYDIAHLSGKDVVGVMTVVTDGELDKSEYRKFKIRQDVNDDTKNLREVLERRLNHLEWPLPNLIVVDGGVGQLNVAKEVLKRRGYPIGVSSVVKDEKHKARGILGESRITNHESRRRAILLANAEAHRFAIRYHRKLRGRGFRI